MRYEYSTVRKKLQSYSAGNLSCAFQMSLEKTTLNFFRAIDAPLKRRD